VHELVDKRRARGLIVPVDRRLAAVRVVVAAKRGLDRRLGGGIRLATRMSRRRMAPLMSETVSWVCTADSTGVESSTRTPRVVSSPASIATCLKRSKILRGLADVRSRSRK